MEIHYKQTTIPYWSTIRVSSVINDDDDLKSKFQNLIYLISWASSLTVKAYEQVYSLLEIFINSLSFKIT